MHSRLKMKSILGVLKFVSKYEDRKVYGKTIPNVMLFKEIMETTAYKTYLAFATRKAIHKKARKRTKAATTMMKESISLMMTNIIFEDPVVALELAKSISKTEAEEQEAARLLHETHKHIVTEKPNDHNRLQAQVKELFEYQSSRRARRSIQVNTDVSEESWGNDSNTEKSDEEEVPWIYSDDDEENKHDNDET
ncbi:hypothetical protein Tco_1139359 [Tanacetum coccineum]